MPRSCRRFWPAWIGRACTRLESRSRKRLREDIKSSLHRGAKHDRLGPMSDLPDELPSDPAELRVFAAALLDRCARLERLLKLAKDAQTVILAPNRSMLARRGSPISLKRQAPRRSIIS